LFEQLRTSPVSGEGDSTVRDESLRRGEGPLYGDGQNVRDWLFVDDHCRGILAVLEGGRAGEIYNIGGGTELTNEELTTRLLDLCGYSDSMIEATTDRLGHDRRYSVDWSKIKNELGYEPQMSFDEAWRTP